MIKDRGYTSISALERSRSWSAYKDISPNDHLLLSEVGNLIAKLWTIVYTCQLELHGSTAVLVAISVRYFVDVYRYKYQVRCDINTRYFTSQRRHRKIPFAEIFDGVRAQPAWYIPGLVLRCALADGLSSASSPHQSIMPPFLAPLRSQFCCPLPSPSPPHVYSV